MSTICICTTFISEFKRRKGWEEREDYDSSEEEFNCHGEEVGPFRKDFGRIGPDKEDLSFEYNYGEEGIEYQFTYREQG